MARLRDDVPVETRIFKGYGRVRVGDTLTIGGIVEGGKVRKLTSPSSRNRRGQIPLEIAEKKKWRLGPEFFTHEEHWWRRREQKYGFGSAQGSWIRKFCYPLSKRAISNLIVIL